MNTGGMLKQAFDEGRVAPSSWAEIQVRDLVLTVATDALAAPVDGVSLRLPVTYDEAKQILRELGCISPTFEMCKEMYRQAARKPQFVPLVLKAGDEKKMMTLDFTRTFNARIDERLADEPVKDGLIFGPWKLWILDPLLSVRGAVNHGFWDRTKRPPAPIQRQGAQHDASHYDYSQVLQPVKRMARHATTGAPVDLTEWPGITSAIPSRFLDPYRPAPTRGAPAKRAAPPRIDLEAALALDGVDVAPVTGWRDRAVPGDFEPVGILLHHTAGPKQGDAPSLRSCVDGRPDLGGPLCHLLVARSGKVHLVAAGRANHAGKGAQQVLDEIVRGEPIEGDARDHGYVDGPLGNGDFYGIEVENDGTGEPYPDAQIRALVRACAAICRAHAWGSERVVHHRQWTRRKIDMSYKDDLRSDIDAALLL